MFWFNRLKPSAITTQMRIQSDPLLLCGQEPFIKSGLPTLPAKQIQIDQIVPNLVTHDGFKPAGARKGAQNITLLLKRPSGEKIHLNRRMGVASHLNKIAGGSLAHSLRHLPLAQNLHVTRLKSLLADHMIGTTRVQQPINFIFRLHKSAREGIAK